jgi:hypothetical protein
MAIDAAVTDVERTGNVHHRGFRQPEASQHILGGLEDPFRGQNHCFVHAHTACFRRSAFLTGQPRDLRGKMASDSPVDPALDLGTQLKNFDGHGDSPFSIPGSLRIGRRAQATPHQWRRN